MERLRHALRPGEDRFCVPIAVMALAGNAVKSASMMKLLLYRHDRYLSRDVPRDGFARRVGAITTLTCNPLQAPSAWLTFRVKRFPRRLGRRKHAH